MFKRNKEANHSNLTSQAAKLKGRARFRQASEAMSKQGAAKASSSFKLPVYNLPTTTNYHASAFRTSDSVKEASTNKQTSYASQNVKRVTQQASKLASELKPEQFKDGLNDVEQPIIEAERLAKQAKIQKEQQRLRSRSGKKQAKVLGDRGDNRKLLRRLRKTQRQNLEEIDGTTALLQQKHLHLGILLLIIAMLVFGLIMIFSASMNIGMYANNDPFFFINRQYIATILGLFVMFIVANFDIRAFNHGFFASLYYLGTQALLLLVLIPGIGVFYNGQRRWLKIPLSHNTTFQPSEIAKVGVPFMLAFYFSAVQKMRERGDFNLTSPWLQRWFDGFIDIALPVGLVLSWCLPISLQSHMSAVLIMLLITFVLLLAMRLPWRSWFYGGVELGSLALALILAILIMKPLLPANFTNRWDHLTKRLQIFAVQNESESDKEKSNIDVDTYHSDQAFIAIASGGLTGTGLGQGKQKLNYLPEGHNDYIFSNIVEELGFIGGVGVLAMFLAFFVIGCSIVTRAVDIFSRLIALGYVFLLTLQGVFSIAVNVGAVPPTGISLPFFSFGGTSNLFFLFAAGCILSVSKFAVTPSLAKRREIQATREQIQQKYRDQGVNL